MIADGGDAWSFAAAREPSQFAAGIDSSTPDVEHAVDSDETLCGIATDLVTVYRHLFEPSHASACSACRIRYAQAPTQPSGQERLHDLVLAAAAGQLRDELVGALRHGAPIRLWINGSARTLAKHYARLDTIVDSADAVATALNNDQRVGLAQIDHDGSQFIVVLPEDGPPLIARATAEL